MAVAVVSVVQCTVRRGLSAVLGIAVVAQLRVVPSALLPAFPSHMGNYLIYSALTLMLIP
jgi:hypothetical protein